MLKRFLNSKNTHIFLLVGIILAGIILRVHFGMKKEYLFIDETFSYGSMSGEYPSVVNDPDWHSQWKTADYYKDFYSLEREDIFNFEQVTINQALDVHPPIYYYLLHISNIFSTRPLDKWAGIGLNILFFILSTIVLFFLSKDILKSRYLALISCVLWGFSVGAITSTMLIRMYEVFTFAVLLFVYFNIKLIDTYERKYLVLVGLTLIFGLLTHYYFLFVIFITYFVIAIKLLRDKAFKKLLIDTAIYGVSGALAFIMYKSMFRHIFMEYRGKGAVEALLSSVSEYLGRIKIYFQIIWEKSLFPKMALVIAALIIIALCLALLTKQGRLAFKKYFSYKFSLIALIAFGYMLAIAKVAPYNANRYAIPIFPIVTLFVLTVLVFIIKIFPKNKALLFSVTIGFVAVVVSIGLLLGNVDYLYEGFTKQFAPVYEQESDSYVFIHRDGGEWRVWNQIQTLVNFPYSYVTDFQSVEKDDLEAIFNDKDKIVLAIDTAEDFEKHLETFIERSDFVTCEKVYEASDYMIYCLTKES